MKRFLLIVPFLFAFYACNQYMLGAGQAVKNLITTPYRGIANMISNNTYDNLREKTLAAKSLAPDKAQPYCAQEGSPSPFDTRGPSALMDAVRDTVCSCKTWGSCGPSTCPCAKLCPENLSILERRPVEENTNIENSLSFRNERVGDSKYTMTEGFCWGHASATSKFNRLAFFKPNTTPPFDINSNNPAEQNKAIEYYKKKIDNIFNNKATDIEGFPNLLSFSSTPSIESYIADKVAEEWAARAMTFQGLRTETSGSPMSEEENSNFLKQVEDKLSLGQQPQIVYSDMDPKTSAHAVLVSHVKTENGKKVFCLRDNNEEPEVNSSCERKMFQNHEGNLLHRNPKLLPARNIEIKLGGKTFANSTYLYEEEIRKVGNKTYTRSEYFRSIDRGELKSTDRYKIVSPEKTRTPNESKEVMEKVIELLEKGEEPEFEFATFKKGNPDRSEKIIDFEKARDGSIALCFGPKPADNKCANSVLAMAPNFKIQVVKEYETMAKIEIAHNDNQDAVAQVDTLVEKCKSEKGCDKEE